VVLFHLSERLPGGFVGVDIFFVISGYIITLILSREIEAGEFSLLQFYRRRIVRIAPASLGLLLAVGFIGLIVLLPTDLKELGQAMISQIVLCGNFYHMREVDYFDLGAEFRPLLHVWSLAVEEQFYIVYPLILALVAGVLKRRVEVVLLIGILASFFLGWMELEDHPRRSFFMIPHRAWELLLGCLIAVWQAKLVLPRRWAEFVGLLGITTLGGVFLFYHPTMEFPGPNALAPCLGTAAILISNLRQQSFVGRCLSFPPLVYLGLISYSLYLWHWPVISFARHLLFELENGMVQFGLAVVSLTLAIPSYHFLEQPFRKRRATFSTLRVFLGFFACSSAVLGFGLWLHLQNGLPNRLTKEMHTVLETPNIRHQPIFDIEAVRRGESISLAQASSEERPLVAIYGDSHAAMYFPLFASLGEKHDLTVNAYYRSGSLPFFEAWNHGPQGGKRQLPYKQAVREALLAAQPQAVILIGRWNSYLGNSVPFLMAQDRQSRSLSLEEGQHAFVRQLNRTLADLREATPEVLLVRPLAEPGFHVPRGLAQAKRLGKWVLPQTKTDQFASDPIDQFVNRAFENASTPVTLVDPDSIIFDSSGSLLLESEAGVYFSDSNHLSTSGSLIFEPLFTPYFEKWGASK